MSDKATTAELENNPNSGHYYKKIGNDFFSKGDYEKAIENYTKAIELDDTQSIFLSNRARCYKELKDFKRAFDDAKSAIELDDKNIKAHLIAGQMLAELGKSEPGFEKINLAINRMTKALTLCAGQGRQVFEKDLNKNILKIKKLKWYKEESIRNQKKKELLEYLKGLIERESAMTAEQRQEKYNDIVELIGDPNKAEDFEIPDYMKCRVTKEVMDDPVTIQSGFSYERSVIVEHFSKSGHNDPITREPVNASLVYPNLNIKQAIEAFLKENPWAFEFKKGETYQNIKF